VDLDLRRGERGGEPNQKFMTGGKERGNDTGGGPGEGSQAQRS